MRLKLTFIFLNIFLSSVHAQWAQNEQATKTTAGNLIMENVPSIPKEVIEKSRQYSFIRSGSFRSWTPDGRSIIIGTGFGETTQLHKVENPLGQRSQITFYNEPIRGGYFSHNKKINGFLFSKDVGGSENWQVFFHNIENGKSTMITDGVSRNSLGGWSNDGQRFAFSSNKVNGKDTHVFISDLDGNTKQLVSLEGSWSALDWSPDDSKVLVRRYVSINESYLHIVNLNNGSVNPFNPSKEKISFGSAKFSKNGKGIYYTSDESTEFRHLRYYDLKSKKHSILTKDIAWDIQSFDLSNDGKLLAFVANENAISKLYIYRTKDLKPLKLPSFPIGQIYGLSFNDDNNRIAMTLNSSQSPGDVYVLNIKNKKLTQWTKSEVGGLNTDNFVSPELVRIKSYDDLEISGFLYLPKDQKGPHPVIISIHGGPESQFRPGFSSRFQYWINELGCAVLATNVRGSAGFGKTFVKLDNGFNREKSVKDIGAFLDMIDNDNRLDSNRIGVYGGSYGGYMVLASMTHYNDRLRAAVDVVGISNFVTFLQNTKSYRRDLRRAEYGDERNEDMYNFLQEISPNNNVKKITKPIFIVQGYNDPRVPVTESEQMRDEIKKNGGDVWYMVAMDEGHGFRKKFNRDYFTNAMSLFWETYLLKD